MKQLLYFFVTIFYVTNSFAQTLTISGTVKDQALNEALPGVSVFVKGTTNGTSTDFDGYYTIPNVEVGSILVFSYIGFTPKEVVVGNNKLLNVSLVEDVSALDEVVVIGYGTQTKKEITGAVSVVGAEKSINVLKDATAGIYGVRAANGVILIKTKTGRKNSPLRVSYDAYGGYQETSRTIPVLNATEYAVIVNEAFAAGGEAPPIPVVTGLGAGTDWQGEVFQKAPIISHNISINGGTEKSHTIYTCCSIF